MNFRIGNTRIRVTGSTAMADRFAALLAPIRDGHDGPADLEFAFADRLADWTGSAPLVMDNVQIAADRYRVADRVWDYEVCCRDGSIHVTLAPRPGGLLYRSIAKSWRYFHTHGRGGYMHYLKRAVFYVYMPVAQQVMLRTGSTFAHCASVERAGRAILFPATGGVGKTSILGKFLNAGWRFLSDDMSVVNADGTVSPNPMPMHIYKFHEIHSPELVGRMVARMAGWDRLLWRALGWVKRPDSLVRWIAPRDVLGDEQLSSGGRIAAVVHLLRDRNASDLSLREASADELADLMAGTLFHEIGPLSLASMQVRCCQADSFVPTLGELYDSIRRTLATAMSKVRCHMLSIPTSASIEQTFRFINDTRLME